MSLPNRRGTWHSWPGALKINFWSWTESNTASEMKCLPPTIVFFRASMYQFIKQLETQLGTLHCWLNIHCVGPSFIQKYYNYSEQYQKIKLHPERKKTVVYWLTAKCHHLPSLAAPGRGCDGGGCHDDGAASEEEVVIMTTDSED